MTSFSFRTPGALWLFGIAVLCAVGCRKKNEAAPEAIVVVQAAHPTLGDLSEEITADAILAPLSQAAISPKVSAPIRAEYVQRGARVRRGQLLVSLEDRDLRGSALDSQGAVTQARANYTATTETTIPENVKKAMSDAAQLKIALDVAAKTSSERRNLYQQGALSGRDADAAYATAAAAEAAYQAAQQHADLMLKTTGTTTRDAAQGQLASANGRLQSAQAQVDYANLRSPIDGVVTERRLFPGESATAGMPVITVMDTSFLLAKLHLAQASAQKLTTGHEAKVSVPGIDAPVDAIVSFISPALDPGSTTVEVWLKLANHDGHLKVGTPVRVTISGNTVHNALQVPATALLPSTEGGTATLVVGSDGAAHKRNVQVGIRTHDAVQITSGLSAADTIVTEGGYGLDDGTKVSVATPGAGEAKN